MQWGLTLCLLLSSLPPTLSAIDSVVTALFNTGGIKTQVYLRQYGPNVRVEFNIRIGRQLSPRWQVHELPVDFSIDPKLRCRPEHVGRFLQHSGWTWDYIYNVTTASLTLHSLIVIVRNQPVACSSIIPFFLPSSVTSTEFKLGIFGRIYIIQWPGEHSLHAYLCV